MRCFLAFLFFSVSIGVGWSANFAIPAQNPEDEYLKFAEGGVYIPYLEITAVEGFDYGMLEVETNAPWLYPTLQWEGNVLGNATLYLWTDGWELTAFNEYDAEVTITDGIDTYTINRYLEIGPRETTKVLVDASRGRVYEGTIFATDLASGEFIATDNLYRGLQDFDLSSDGTVLYGINASQGVEHGGDPLSNIRRYQRTLYSFDADSLELIDLFELPWGDLGRAQESYLAAGPGNVVYYTEAALNAGFIHVLDLETGQEIQRIRLNDDQLRVRRFALSPDRTKLFASGRQYSSQYSTHYPYFESFDIADDGRLSRAEFARKRPRSGDEDAPVLVSGDGEKLFIRNWQLNPNSLSEVVREFPAELYSISEKGKLAGIEGGVINVETGEELWSFHPIQSTVQAFSPDGVWFIFHDAVDGVTHRVNLFEELPAEALDFTFFPEPNASYVRETVTELAWESVVGATGYRVYFSNEIGLETADTDSDAYMGEYSATRFKLPEHLDPGKYFWRLDLLIGDRVYKGGIIEFDIVDLLPSIDKVVERLIEGAEQPKCVDLTASGQVSSWQVVSKPEWIRLVQASGNFPGELELSLDARNLAPGAYEGELVISANGTDEDLEIPLSLTVDAMDVEMVAAVPGSPIVCALSRVVGDENPLAYLLKYDARSGRLLDHAIIEGDISDFVLHDEDERLYLRDMHHQQVHAFDAATLEFIRPYEMDFEYWADNPDTLLPFGGDQLLLIPYNRLDTETGALERKIVPINNFPYGVVYINDGLAYVGGPYHREVTLYEYDGDTFTSLKSFEYRASGDEGYLVASEDRSRFFMNGAVLDSQLNLVSETGVPVFASTADGSFAFSQSSVFDTRSGRIVDELDSDAELLAYSTGAEALVYLRDGRLEFERWSDPSPKVYPQHGGVFRGVSQLSWADAAIGDEYRVSLSLDGGKTFHIIGDVEDNEIQLETPINYGEVFWRVDYLTEHGYIQGSVHSFTVASLVPDQFEVLAETVLGENTVRKTISYELYQNEEWELSVQAPWLSAEVGDSKVELVFEAESLVPGKYDDVLLFTNVQSGQVLSVPVTFQVYTVDLLLVESHKRNNKVYGISKFDDGTNNTLLLEVNTETEQVERVKHVGSGASALAIHYAENRIYVASWDTGQLSAISLDDFEVVQTYSFVPRKGVTTTTGGGDCYRIYAGPTGRLVVTAENTFADTLLIDTESGAKIDSMMAFHGTGATDLSGRYYYHGDFSHNMGYIKMYDLADDSFNLLARERPLSGSNWGSPYFVLSGNDQRVFWNQDMYSSDLSTIEAKGNLVACTHDGLLGITHNRIFDIDSWTQLLGTPEETSIVAHNEVTDKLVVERDNRLAFFALPDPIALKTPTQLLAADLAPDSVWLEWQDCDFETEYRVRYRKQGDQAWKDWDVVSGHNDPKAYISGLDIAQIYEFQVQAIAPAVVSAWSNSIIVELPAPELDAPYLLPLNLRNSRVLLRWESVRRADRYMVERLNLEDSTEWVPIAEVRASDPLEFFDSESSVNKSDWRYPELYYRVRATNFQSNSAVSNERTVTNYRRAFGYTNGPQLPLVLVPPHLQALSSHNGALRIVWFDCRDETGYVLERDAGTGWIEVASLPADTVSFLDADTLPGNSYSYRIKALYDTDESAYSDVASRTSEELTYSIDGAVLTADVQMPILMESGGALYNRLDEPPGPDWNSNPDGEYQMTGKLIARIRYNLETGILESFELNSGRIVFPEFRVNYSFEVTFDNGTQDDVSFYILSSGLKQKPRVDEPLNAMIDGSYILNNDAHSIKITEGVVSTHVYTDYEQTEVVDSHDYSKKKKTAPFEGVWYLEVGRKPLDTRKDLVCVRLFNETDETYSEPLEDTIHDVVTHEVARLVAETDFLVPSKFDRWATSHELPEDAEFKTSGRGLSYSLLHAFGQELDSHSLPFELETYQGEMCVYVDYPDEGLNSDVRLLYKADLGSQGKWYELGSSYLIEGKPMWEGESGEGRYLFPEGESGFIRLAPASGF